MAGINVPQYDIFKIETRQLKYGGWSLDITKEEAYEAGSLVALFESEMFRLVAEILGRPPGEIDFSEHVASIVVSNKKHFARAVSHEGVVINGRVFRRFVGTSGGLKKNSIIFVDAEILDELNRRCECGRRRDVPMVPAKYETYKALTCSASQRICEPRGVLVVSDCLIKIRDVVKVIDDSGGGAEPEVSEPREMELENNACDGFNLCTIGYMERVAESLGLNYVPAGVCLRNAWLKGMLYPFPIMEFADEVAGGGYMVQDIWGEWRDIRDVELIINESTLKLWKCYGGIEEYLDACAESGYGFAVTKIAPERLEDTRAVNYQYLQSYELTDDDIKKLCQPTIEWLKDSMGGDYKAALTFLGINEQVEKNSWQEALLMDERMLDNPFIIKAIYRMIRLKIDEAKIGKLLVHGNYQLLSGDPYIFMEHVFGLKPKGLLKANECYSKYWIDESTKEIVAFRSPMTVHNNIRKMKVIENESVEKWYRYMPTIFIINGFDTFCQAENGADYDGDAVFITDNDVLVEKHIKMPAILCLQKNTEKVIPTEDDVLATNINAMGNKVGSITNRATSMMDKQSYFEKDSREWTEIQKRIECGQLYQQNEIDKIKGIVAKPMPEYWYEPAACGENDYLYSICTSKKPYFMIYIYETLRAEYRRFMEAVESDCNIQYGSSVAEILQQGNEDFARYYNKKNPVSDGRCTMNRICHYMEKVFEEYKVEQRQSLDWSSDFMKYGAEVSEDARAKLMKLAETYCAEYSIFKKASNHTKTHYRDESQWLKKKYRDLAEMACPDEKERLDIVLDLDFDNKFLWNCTGHLIIKRLKELNE